MYYLFGMEIRFRPKRCASIDQAPGPSIARLAAIEAAITEAHHSSTRELAIQSSTSADTTPAMGVQSPTIKKTPRPAARSGIACCSKRADVRDALRASCIRKAKRARRNTRRPFPGQPLVNVENRRCKKDTRPSIYDLRARPHPQKG